MAFIDEFLRSFIEFLTSMEEVILAMADDWLLEYLAKVSTLSCILVIIYFLVYSFWRIPQMPNYPWNWHDWQFPLGGRYAVEIFRKPTEMPFTLSIIDRNREDIDQGAFNLMFLKDKAPPQVTVLWGPSVPYLMKLINSTWQELDEALRMGNLQPGEWDCLLNQPNSSSSSEANNNSSESVDAASSLNYFTIQRLNYKIDDNEDELDNQSTTGSKSHRGATITISPPNTLDWGLLKNQYRYPAVIFVTSSEQFSDNEEFCIRGVIQILHIKNEVFSTTSATLAQYIKMSNGQHHMLQPLYVIDDHRLEEEDDDVDESGATNTNINDLHSPLEPFNDILCSVCQVMPVSRVIIPCRHVCLCSQCFQKVELCPICRGAIFYYFRTREESNLSNHIENSASLPENLTWRQRLSQAMDNFSDAMGLIRQY